MAIIAVMAIIIVVVMTIIIVVVMAIIIIVVMVIINFVIRNLSVWMLTPLCNSCFICTIVSCDCITLKLVCVYHD